MSKSHRWDSSKLTEDRDLYSRIGFWNEVNVYVTANMRLLKIYVECNGIGIARETKRSNKFP